MNWELATERAIEVLEALLSWPGVALLALYLIWSGRAGLALWVTRNVDRINYGSASVEFSRKQAAAVASAVVPAWAAWQEDEATANSATTGRSAADWQADANNHLASLVELLQAGGVFDRLPADVSVALVDEESKVTLAEFRLVELMDVNLAMFVYSFDGLKRTLSGGNAEVAVGLTYEEILAVSKVLKQRGYAVTVPPFSKLAFDNLRRPGTTLTYRPLKSGMSLTDVKP